MRNLILLTLISVLLINCDSNQHPLTDKTVIAVQPYEGFESNFADTVKTTLNEMYGVQVVLLDDIEIPQRAFVNIKSARYRADTLIHILKDDEVYKDYDYVIGLIGEDISCTKYSDYKSKTIKSPAHKYRDWGIFGLGFRPGKSCIVSTFRLKKSTSKENFIERLKKVSCHEMGHNLGLPHCPNKECIMQDAAETIKTVDNVELHLCNNCRNKIGLK